MEHLRRTNNARDPETLKIDLDLLEGMENRILRRLRRGETLAEMYAEMFNSLRAFDGVDIDQDSIEFQRKIASGMALMGFIATEYMEEHGWKFNDESHTLEKPTKEE